MSPLGSIVVITAYRDPKYVRANVLIELVKRSSLFSETFIVQSSAKGFRKYLIVLWKLITVKVTKNPDYFLITFRGYEVLFPVLLIAGKKKVIYDEFISPIEWLIYEHHKLQPGEYPARLLKQFISSLMNKCQLILTDTISHARVSSQLSGIALHNYGVVEVGCDESLFSPRTSERKQSEHLAFLIYGNGLPLHGMPVVYEAVRDLLVEGYKFKLTVVGGGVQAQDNISRLKEIGVNAEFIAWVQTDQLSLMLGECDVFLGGPFGGTFQAQHVITGKTFQALCTATPVIVGKNYESEVFLDKENALVVRQGEPKELADAMKWCIQNRFKLDAIGERGRSLYLSNFSAEVLSLKFREMLLMKFPPNMTDIDD